MKIEYHRNFIVTVNRLGRSMRWVPVTSPQNRNTRRGATVRRGPKMRRIICSSNRRTVRRTVPRAPIQSIRNGRQQQLAVVQSGPVPKSARGACARRRENERFERLQRERIDFFEIVTIDSNRYKKQSLPAPQNVCLKYMIVQGSAHQTEN